MANYGNLGGLWIPRFEDARTTADIIKWSNHAGAELTAIYRALHEAGTHFDLSIQSWAGAHPLRQQHRLLSGHYTQPLHKGAEATMLAAKHQIVFSQRVRKVRTGKIRTTSGSRPRVNFGGGS